MWENRLHRQPNAFCLFSNANTALDGTECPVQRPLHEPFQEWYYSGKKGRHTALYEGTICSSYYCSK
jgi:hypothetical protein